MNSAADFLPLANGPFLLVPKQNRKDASPTDCFNFVSAVGNIVIEKSIPALYNKTFIGCQYGWLAIINAYCEPSLYNILTGESVSLPSISTLPNVRPMLSLDGSLDSYRHHHQRELGTPNFLEYTPNCLSECVTFSKLVFSSDPSLSTGTLFVAALFNYPECLAYARPDEGRWKFLDCKEIYVDILFRQDGSLLALTYVGAVYRYKLLEDGNFVKTEISPPFDTTYSDNHKYLIEDSNQGLMQVWREYNYDDDRSETCDIKVLKLITDVRGNKKWETILNLDDKSIFIGIGMTKLLSNSLHCTIRPNCVYFTDDWWDLLAADVYRMKMRDIGMYNMKDGVFEECCPGELLNCAWPLPVWIVF